MICRKYHQTFVWTPTTCNQSITNFIRTCFTRSYHPRQWPTGFFPILLAIKGIHLCQKTMQCKTSDVFGKSCIEYQWLSVKHVIDPNDKKLLFAPFFEFKDLLDTAKKSFLSENIRKY